MDTYTHVEIHRHVLRNPQIYMQYIQTYTQVVEIHADYIFAHKDTWHMYRYIGTEMSTDAYTYRLTETHTCIQR